MAYTSDKKSTDLDALTAIANDDVLIVGDYDDSGIAKKITKTNFRTTFDATSSVKGFVTLSTAPATATAPIACGTNDDRLPSQGENDALAGTSGTPSSSNKYVTNADTAETGNSKVVRTTAGGLLNTAIIPVQVASSSGIATRAKDAASGTQTIAHGLPRVPYKVNVNVWMLGVDAEETFYCKGVYTGSGNCSVASCPMEGGSSAGTDTLYTSTSYAIGITSNSAANPYNNNGQLGVISVDATNITITWTRHGDVANTIYIMWDAIC